MSEKKFCVLCKNEIEGEGVTVRINGKEESAVICSNCDAEHPTARKGLTEVGGKFFAEYKKGTLTKKANK